MLRVKNRIKTEMAFVVMDGHEEKAPEARAENFSIKSKGCMVFCSYAPAGTAALRMARALLTRAIIGSRFLLL